MNDRHLTDEQIQTLLDGAAAETVLLGEHVRACPQCNGRYEEYRRLYSVLAEMPEPALAPDFAAQVLMRLPAAAPASEKSQRWAVRDGVVVFAALGALITTAIFFVQPEFMSGLLGNWFSSLRQTDSQISSALSGHLSAVKINPALIAGVLLAMLAIAALDHIITRRRHRDNPAIHMI